MEPQEVTFEGRAGRRLAGSWHARSGDAFRGVVVAAHGMLSSRASAKHRELCERAVEAGFAALRFDFAGRGDSPGRSADLTVSGEVADLLAAISWTRRRTDAPVAVVGSSLGGTVAVLAAARARPAAMVTIAAPAELPRQPRAAWVADPAAQGDPGSAAAPEVPASFFDDARRHDPVAAARSIRCPWLVVHGARDEVVPVDHARMLAAACPSATLLVHSRADHRFWTASHRRWLVARTIAFVAATIGS